MTSNALPEVNLCKLSFSHLDQIQRAFPAGFYASPKLDGFRYRILEEPVESVKATRGVKAYTSVYSRGAKPLPNRIIRAELDNFASVIAGFDGELLVADEEGVGNFQQAAAINRIDDVIPNWKFFVFDCFAESVRDLPYADRMAYVIDQIAKLPASIANHLVITPYKRYTTATEEELGEILEEWEHLTTEGLIIRDPNAPYINGRNKSVAKFKPYEHIRCKIVGYEQLHYGHDLKTVPKELWGTPKPMVRTLKLEPLPGEPFYGVVINAGSGLTKEARLDIWANPSKYLGNGARVRYVPCGSKSRPRFPIVDALLIDWDTEQS